MLHRRTFENTMSGPILCEKAVELSMKLAGESPFISSGGLKHFKLQHEIPQIQFYCQKSSFNEYQTLIDDEIIYESLNDDDHTEDGEQCARWR